MKKRFLNLLAKASVVLIICFGLATHHNPLQAADSSHLVVDGSRPAMVIDKNNRLHLVYQTIYKGAKVPDIFYCSSKDGGVNWTSPRNISQTAGFSHRPLVVVESNGAIDVVWREQHSEEKLTDIFFVRSADGGQNWTAAVNISQAGSAVDPAIVVGKSDSLHVVWSAAAPGDCNSDIFYINSIDQGTTWSAPRNISKTPGHSIETCLAASDEDVIRVSWVDATPGSDHPDIYYALCKGGAWDVCRDVSRSIGISSQPTLAEARNKFFLAWSDNSKKAQAPDIWLDSAVRTGKFSRPVNISNTPGVSSEPIVMAEGNILALVWIDTSTGSETPSVYGRISLDQGGDFTEVMNISGARERIRHPAMVVSHGKMYTAWEEGPETPGQGIIRINRIELTGLATGPAMPVDPTIHGVSGNMH